jgi:hypothetical protein
MVLSYSASTTYRLGAIYRVQTNSFILQCEQESKIKSLKFISALHKLSPNSDMTLAVTVFGNSIFLYNFVSVLFFKTVWSTEY